MKRHISLLLAIVMVFALLPVGASAAKTLKASSKILNYIKSKEGCRLTAYHLDGETYWTIGYGHYGPDVKKGQTITQTEADALFAQDLKKYETAVNNYNTTYNLNLTQNRFDALVSFTYNCGEYWVNNDWRIARYLKNNFKDSKGNPIPDLEIADAFGVISNGGVGGLVARRMEEAKIFLYGDYDGTGKTDFVAVILDPAGGTLSTGNKVAIYYKGQPYGTLPAVTKSGYKLQGWYSEKYDRFITATTVAAENLYLDAVWVSSGTQTEYTLTVKDGSGSGKYKPGEKIYVTPVIKPGYCFVGWESGDTPVSFDAQSGGYYIIMPFKSVTVKAIYNEGCIYGSDCPSKKFNDVDALHWAHEGIDFCVANKLFIGTSASTFSPEEPMTRAMIVTVLYRLAGSPSVSGYKNPYSDLVEDYYYNAVLWASKYNIASGNGYAMFLPDENVSREEFSAMLMRYAAYIGYNVDNFTDSDLSIYSDSGMIRSDHRQSMSWAISVGIIIGTSETTLEPRSGATRAQIATMLLRFMQAYVTV